MNIISFRNRLAVLITGLLILCNLNLLSQVYTPYTRIDLFIIRGENYKVIDTCKQVLASDSLNPEIWYRLGLAYQNLMSDDNSFSCFSKAATLSPGNNRYNFMVAKGLYNKDKNEQALTYLEKLVAAEPMNWAYSHYLSSIYMQERMFEKAIKIYQRFNSQDTTNYLFIDKIGFALLKSGDFDGAEQKYIKSLSINKKNVSALKNLAYIYSYANKVDTALKVLDLGIAIDPSDPDLYVRRAAINYAINYNKRALNDYLKVLSLGDSSTLYLKRAGIGYSNNLQPAEAIKYLTLAYSKDSSDYETASYLAQNYYNRQEQQKSVRYYKRVIKLLNPIEAQFNISIVMLAESQKGAGLYKDAISSYIRATRTSTDNNLNMIIANLYDEKLKDIPKAIHYYQIYLDNAKTQKSNFPQDYIESVRKRMEFLKNPIPAK
jgi:tetratricopeptide (TPR) repeat protein